MVLELKVPHGANWADLMPLLPTFWSYVLSFVFVGLYWNNHRHMLQTIQRVNGQILWANLLLLFWLSLVPFATAWMGENHFASGPVALYGIVIFCAGMGFMVLSRALIRFHGKDSNIARAIGRDRKGFLSQALMAVGVAVAFVAPVVAITAYVVVAALWFVPDRRFERAVN